jgi:hypothetical protein
VYTRVYTTVHDGELACDGERIGHLPSDNSKKGCAACACAPWVSPGV